MQASSSSPNNIKKKGIDSLLLLPAQQTEEGYADTCPISLYSAFH